jgi:hypothetical protein
VSIIVSVGDYFSFSSDATAAFKLKDLQGWWDGPSPRLNLVDRPMGDGSFSPSPVYRSSRALTLTAFLTHTDELTAAQDWETWSALGATGDPLQISVQDAAGTKSAQVYISSPGAAIQQITALRAAVQLSMVMVDPVKYGDVQTFTTLVKAGGGGLVYPLYNPDGTMSYSDGLLNASPGTVQMQNVGTAQSYPSLHITGGFNGGWQARVFETGDIIRYPRSMTSTDYIDINMRIGRALLNGVSDCTSDFSALDFFSVPPKDSRTMLFTPVDGGASLGGTLTASFRPGYW